MLKNSNCWLWNAPILRKGDNEIAERPQKKSQVKPKLSWPDTVIDIISITMCYTSDERHPGGDIAPKEGPISYLNKGDKNRLERDKRKTLHN